MLKQVVFHTGEFARMVGVNKKTLHYYDAQGIFCPDSVAPNGYRCYSSRQLYAFQMIRTLRELGLSLEEIRAYLQQRSPQRLAALLKGQQEWLAGELRRYRRMQRLVKNNIALLERAMTVECGCVVLEDWPEARLAVSENVRSLPLAEHDPFIQRYINDCREKELDDGYPPGAMVACEDFAAGHELDISYYFTRTDQPARAIPAKFQGCRPAGRYAVLYQRGDYMDTRASYAALRRFLAEQHLRPGEYSYEEYIIEDMCSDHPEDYITRIAVPVKPAGLR